MSDDALDPKTFDIVAVLQGRNYPTIAVPFYVDEAAAFELSRIEKDLTLLERLSRVDEYEKREQDREALKEKLKASRYVYHLRGISNKVRDDLLAEALAKFPRERVDGIPGLLGQEEDNRERDKWLGIRLLLAMTEKIVAPDGAEMRNLTVEQLEAFQENAPQVALDAIFTGQSELADGVKAGFEQAAQDPDFS